MKRFINPQFSPACAAITAGVAISCTIKQVAGTTDKLILFNYDEIASYTRNGTNTQIIEAITMVVNVPAYTGFAFEGKQQSLEPKQTLVRTRYNTGWDHEVVFKVFDSQPTTKQQIEKMAESRLVAIVENNFKGTAGNAAYEVYGIDTGLYMLVGERNVSDPESMGAFNVTLKTDLSKEGHLPATFFLTDYATTKALVEALYP